MIVELFVQGEALDPAELIKRLNTLLVAPSNLRRSPSESQNSISSSGSSNPSMYMYNNCKIYYNIQTYAVILGKF